MDSRCGECGSPVRSNHDGNIVCTRDESHGRGVAFGGVGSGWSAAGGHTPGSQGGHAAAARAHQNASEAHEAAAILHSRTGESPSIPESRAAEAGSADAAKATAAATRASKETGAKSYEAQAAQTYSKMVANAPTNRDAAQYHRQAAQYHRGAAHAHNVFAGEKK